MPINCVLFENNSGSILSNISDVGSVWMREKCVGCKLQNDTPNYKPGVVKSRQRGKQIGRVLNKLWEHG